MAYNWPPTIIPNQLYIRNCWKLSYVEGTWHSPWKKAFIYI